MLKVTHFFGTQKNAVEIHVTLDFPPPPENEGEERIDELWFLPYMSRFTVFEGDTDHHSLRDNGWIKLGAVYRYYGQDHIDGADLRPEPDYVP